VWAQDAPQPAAKTLTCKVDGAEAITVAGSLGFAFEAAKIAGSGSCSLLLPSAIAASAQTGDGVSCRIRYFGSRKLVNGWKLKEVQFTGASYTYEREPAWQTDNPEVVIVVKLAAAKEDSILLLAVTLETASGDCKKWQEAFH